MESFAMARSCGPILLAGALEMHHLAVAGHQRHRTDEFAVGNHLLHQRTERRQTIGAHADFGRHGVRQTFPDVLASFGQHPLRKAQEGSEYRTAPTQQILHRAPPSVLEERELNS